MILVTVGGQVAFDRLVRTVDAWAERQGRDDVLCQILDGTYEPAYARWVRTLSSEAFQEHLLAADVIVAHAGMGTILTALEHAKPILVFPRQAALGEQRNDHQLATAKRFRELGTVRVAMDENELRDALDRIDEITSGPRIGSSASQELLDAVRAFVHA